MKKLINVNNLKANKQLSKLIARERKESKAHYKSHIMYMAQLFPQRPPLIQPSYNKYE